MSENKNGPRMSERFSINDEDAAGITMRDADGNETPVKSASRKGTAALKLALKRKADSTLEDNDND